MTTVLVVDDLVTDRLLVGGLLKKHTGWTIVFANNGQEALEEIESHLPDIVLTDMMMPLMGGLELAETIKRQYPLIPVILMTSKGSEDVAVQALQRGATSYVPKRQLARELLETVERVLSVAKEQRSFSRLLNRMTQSEFAFEIENDLDLLQTLGSYIQAQLKSLRLFSEPERVRIGVALEEAFLNAFYHGNLEVSSKLREDDYNAYYELARQRCGESPYQERRIFVTIRLAREQVEFVITDQGPGFDPKSLPDPRDPENLERPSGRGVLLMRTFFDEVEYNAQGNSVRMLKRRVPSMEPETAGEETSE